MLSLETGSGRKYAWHEIGRIPVKKGRGKPKPDLLGGGLSEDRGGADSIFLWWTGVPSSQDERETQQRLMERGHREVPDRGDKRKKRHFRAIGARKDTDELKTLKERYKVAKKTLKIAFRRAKEEAWRNIS